MRLMRPWGMPVAVLLILLIGRSEATAQAVATLEAGWRMMYGLDFRSADQVFAQWRREHPRDPLGPMSSASTVLFEELDRRGVLQAQFFIDDASFLARRSAAPDPALRERFESALAESEALARRVLAAEPENHDALFALAMVYGLRADYAGLVEGRNMAFLSDARKAAALSRTLLDLAPDYADAHLANGITQYIVGSLFAPLRWVLRVAGYAGDRAGGMDEVRLTAERGRFLGPFARILLAIAYLRAHDVDRARQLLAGLAQDFPTNTLVVRELQRLDGRVH